MNLFPKAATAVTEIRQHPAYLYYSSAKTELRDGEDRRLFVLMKGFSGMVDANPGRYVNGICLDSFISDFPSHSIAMDALELLKKMRVYKVSEAGGVAVLNPCKVARPKTHRTVTCISVPTYVLETIKDAARERGIAVSALITELALQNLGETN